MTPQGKPVLQPFDQLGDGCNFWRQISNFGLRPIRIWHMATIDLGNDCKLRSPCVCKIVPYFQDLVSHEDSVPMGETSDPCSIGSSRDDPTEPQSTKKHAGEGTDRPLSCRIGPLYDKAEILSLTSNIISPCTTAQPMSPPSPSILFSRLRTSSHAS